MQKEQKKALAEWMRFYLSHITADTFINTEFEMRPPAYPPEDDILFKDNKPVYYFDEWNPHTNNTQFLEVLRHMTPADRQDLKDNADLNDLYEQEEPKDIFLDTIWIMSHKQEVITALLETKET